MKEKTIDIIILIGFVVILLVGIFSILYYFHHDKNECIKDPFVYGAKQLEDKTTGRVGGFGYIISKKVASVSFSFNSTDINYNIRG